MKKDYSRWYVPKDPTPRELCPCCDYVTLLYRGTCQLCPICFWEDEALEKVYLS